MTDLELQQLYVAAAWLTDDELEAVQRMVRSYDPKVVDFYKIVVAGLLSIRPTDVTDEQRNVVKSALFHRSYGANPKMRRYG